MSVAAAARTIAVGWLDPLDGMVGWDGWMVGWLNILYNIIIYINYICTEALSTAAALRVLGRFFNLL